MRVKRYLMRYPKDRRTMLVGPNCAGIISPGKAMLGIMPPHIYLRGTVGIISRSGTLGYEAAAQMKALGIGRRPASASAAIRSTAAPSWITSLSSRRTRRPKPC